MKIQKAICSIRNGVDGNHNLADLNQHLASGWAVTQVVSDCQSAIVYILETGKDDSDKKEEEQ